MQKQKKLAVVAKNPIVYHAPLYKEFASQGNGIEVFYLDDMGVGELTDREFGITITWDVPLLEGYGYRFLKNWSLNRYGGFFARINPGLFPAISKATHSAVLVTGYDTFSCWFALFVAKLKGVPVIWRGEAVLRSKDSVSRWKSGFKMAVLTRFFRLCDAVLFSCSGNREYLEYYGVEASKLFPIPCAVDNSYFSKEHDKYAKERDRIRSGLGIGRNEFVILFSARFTTRKRPLDLLAAVSRIPHEDITVLFVGDGTERRAMEDYAVRNNIKTVFPGFVNQQAIGKYYAISDVAVVISDYDPSPKAMNEAMNFALPVIATNVLGTARDLVFHGENGFRVDVGDIAAISGHLHELNTDREKARAMGRISREIVRGWNFSECAAGIKQAVDFVSAKP